jgi:hypothetical protein
VTPLSLGIFASANTTVGTSFESIATVTGTGSSNTLEFTSIPSTYTHLQIRGIMRSASANNYDNAFITFNGSGSSYAAHYLAGDGASASAFAWTSAGRIESFYAAGGGALTDNYSTCIVDILDYTSVNKNKTVRILNGYDNNNNGATNFAKGFVTLSSGLWYATPAAITSVTITNSQGANWSNKTTFALYGIRSA